jgi:hypothetical protein
VRTLERAVGAGADDRAGTIYLDPEPFVTAMQRLYVLHGRRGELGAAVEVFENLADFRDASRAANYEQAIAAMRPTYERIMTAVDTEQLIVVPAKIDQFHYWFGRLLRRSFGLSSVVGRVEAVDIRCMTGTARFGFASEEQVWNIPESWGDCHVYVKGEPGTTFAVHEYPRVTNTGAEAALDPPAR